MSSISESGSSLRWGIASTVAWVDAEEDVIAFVNLSSGSDYLPRIVAGPATCLWRAIAECGATREELDVAAAEAGLPEHANFVSMFITSLLELSALEGVAP